MSIRGNSARMGAGRGNRESVSLAYRLRGWSAKNAQHSSLELSAFPGTALPKKRHCGRMRRMPQPRMFCAKMSRIELALLTCDL